ncbi:TadE/TadG family type IV pilus assembly protein [Roseibium polysiphoniae]|uniref:TadE/TadG family type IV pilus assembly protein n=1 Tax=Roseibium polysiphoniae TaxID=2571221 RepID=UPI0032996E21
MVAAREQNRRRDTASQFTADRSGVAAVEFALILPFLLLLLIGMAETTSALNQDRKVSQIASSVADLVAQSESISTSEAADIMLAASAIMSPYESSRLSVTIASVSFDGNGNAEVDWSVDQDGGTPWPTGSEPPIDIPDTVAKAGTSLVVGQSNYTYIPMFASLAQNLFPSAATIPMGDVYFLRPRLSTSVTFN